MLADHWSCADHRKTFWFKILPRDPSKSVTTNLEMFPLVAGYPDFLCHPIQTSPLWGLHLPSMGSGGRLGHCHGLHHLDSSGRRSHFVGATWLNHAGDIYLPSYIAGSTCVVHVLCVHIIGAFPLQKLKLSLTPYTLNEISKMPYYERGGRYGEPVIAVISSNVHLPEKPPIETNLWYQKKKSGRLLQNLS